MASVSISINRDNGTVINATGVVPDAMLTDTAAMIGAMLFEATTAETPAP